jgi:hypothetical protein
MDFEQGARQDSPFGGDRAVLLLAGFALIGLGLAALLYLAGEIVNAYNAPLTHHFIADISKGIGNARIMVDGKALSINEGAALGASIFLFAIFAGLGISIAGLLIKSGARLISPNLNTELAKIRRKLEEIGGGASSRHG